MNMVRGWVGDYTDDTCSFGSMAGVARRDALKAEIRFSECYGNRRAGGYFSNT